MESSINRSVFAPAAGVSPFSTLRKSVWHKRSTLWAVLPLPLLDAACIALSMIAAGRLRFQLLEYSGPSGPAVEAFYMRLVLIALVPWLLTFGANRLYHTDNLFGGTQEYVKVLYACTFGVLWFILYSFLNRHIEYDISRGWLATTWFFSVVSVSLTRFGYRRLIYSLRRRGFFTRRALVVGINEEGQAVVDQLRESPSAGVQVVGFVNPAQHSGSRMEGVPVLNGLNRLGNFIRSLNVDDLIVIPTALRREELLDIYRDWGTDERLRICLSSGLYEMFTTGAKVRSIGFVPMVSLNRTRITGMDALLKRTLDLVVAAVLIALLGVFVLPFVALAIWLDSPGPIFYQRRVVGLHGRRFDAHKLRTMITDSEAFMDAHPELKEEWERTGKIQNDPRVTRLGHFLRRYSLDELPQLLNVLKGQMSLVGPRMITPAELRHFHRWRHNLLTVKPGMTGLWQVSGRSDLSYEERVKLDMQYIRNYTIWQDLKLMLSTIGAVFKGRGAY